MKGLKLFPATAVACLVVSASSSSVVPEIQSDSILGRNLLSHARRINEDNNAASSMDWLTSYAVKFQGCHNIKMWNDNANNNQGGDKSDVKISTTSLILFRLCPANSCSATKGAGCTAGYGDYVMDTSTFVQTYYEAARQATEYQCQLHLQNNCQCQQQEGEEEGEGNNQEMCEYDCFYNAKMAQCIENNPYEQQQEGEQQQEQFDAGDYLACKELEVQNNNNNGRSLNDNNEQVRYYVGPYCANQGGAVYLGLFTDDTCSTAASSDVTFESLTGRTTGLPYSSTSLVDSSCLSCVEPANVDEQNENDQAVADAVSDQCETLYGQAGKCESKLDLTVASGLYELNEAACNYIQGIKIVRQDGIIISASPRPSAVATSFIVISAMAFCAMAFYVWYLRTRLGVKQNTLL